MLLGTLISVFGIADLLFLFKQVSKYKQLTQLIKFLNQSQYLNVDDVLKQFDGKPIGAKLLVIVKGLIKAKQNNLDKNILSTIISTPINKADRLKQYLFERIPYQQVLNKAFWIRPQQLSNVSFNLKDLESTNKISISSCKGSDVAGILTDLKSFQTKVQGSANMIISFFKELFNSVMFLSPFKFSNKIGEKISYYGIMNNSFGYVVGEARKKANGEIAIQNPRYITKQISFILNRLRSSQKIYRYALILYIFVQLVLLFYFVRWFYRTYGSKLRFLQEQAEVEDENIPFHQLCIVCYSAARSVIFKPCRHYGICFNCYNRINQQNCPVCKEPIEGIIRVIKK